MSSNRGAYLYAKIMDQVEVPVFQQTRLRAQAHRVENYFDGKVEAHWALRGLWVSTRACLGPGPEVDSKRRRKR